MTYRVTVKQIDRESRVFRTFTAHYPSSGWRKDEIFDHYKRAFNMDSTIIEIEEKNT